MEWWFDLPRYGLMWFGVRNEVGQGRSEGFGVLGWIIYDPLGDVGDGFAHRAEFVCCRCRAEWETRQQICNSVNNGYAH